MLKALELLKDLEKGHLPEGIESVRSYETSMCIGCGQPIQYRKGANHLNECPIYEAIKELEIISNIVESYAQDQEYRCRMQQQSMENK